MTAVKLSIGAGTVLLGLGAWGIATGGDPHHIAIFAVNPGHNVIHVTTGALALIAGLSGVRASARACFAFGVLYGLLAVLGFFEIAALVRMLHLNTADNALHLAVGAVCLWGGGSGETS